MKTLSLVALTGAIFFVLALTYAGWKRGWMRHGYFSLPATVLIVLGLFLLFQTVGGILVVSFLGASFIEHGKVLLVLNGIAQLMVMLVGTVMFVKALGMSLPLTFRLEGIKQTPFGCYVLALPLILAAQGFGGAISAIWMRGLAFFPSLYQAIQKFESLTSSQTELLVTANTRWELVVVLITVSLIPALSEETLFRGFAMSNIERSGKYKSRPWVAIVVSSVVFASIHLSISKLPGLLFLGLALGWMAYRTSNLLVGAIAHAANNGIIVLALYIAPRLHLPERGQQLMGISDPSFEQGLVMLAISVPFAAGFIYLFKIVSERIPARGYAENDVYDAVMLEFPSRIDETITPSEV